MEEIEKEGGGECAKRPFSLFSTFATKKDTKNVNWLPSFEKQRAVQWWEEGQNGSRQRGGKKKCELETAASWRRRNLGPICTRQNRHCTKGFYVFKLPYVWHHLLEIGLRSLTRFLFRHCYFVRNRKRRRRKVREAFFLAGCQSFAFFPLYYELASSSSSSSSLFFSVCSPPIERPSFSFPLPQISLESVTASDCLLKNLHASYWMPYT